MVIAVESSSHQSSLRASSRPTSHGVPLKSAAISVSTTTRTSVSTNSLAAIIWVVSQEAHRSA
jgi:hypothetical protein